VDGWGSPEVWRKRENYIVVGAQRLRPNAMYQRLRPNAMYQRLRPNAMYQRLRPNAMYQRGSVTYPLS